MTNVKTALSLICVSALSSMVFVGCDNIPGFSKKPKETPKTTAAAQTPIATPSTDSSALPKNVLARVGNWTLTLDEFNDRLALLKKGLPDFNDKDSNTRRMVLDELIRQQLMVKDAEDTGVNNQKDIKDAVDDFRKTLLVQEVANRLTRTVAATEEDAQKYYNDNKREFVEPTVWKVREIVVADEATAKNILSQLLQGGDFAALAQSQSKGKTAAQGGELKEFRRAPFEAMQNAISILDTGGISGVFKGPEGFYIVKVDSKKGGAPQPFEKVKTELISALTLRKQQQVVMDYLNKLAEKNKVDVNQELLGTIAGDRGK